MLQAEFQNKVKYLVIIITKYLTLFFRRKHRGNLDSNQMKITKPQRLG
jgi:hypothetical protein